MEVLLNILFIIGSIHNASCMFLYYRDKHRPVYISERMDGWFDIEKHPIPDGIECILTDGCRVRSYGSLIDYNKNGKVIMGYDKRLVTHWIPYPNLPK